MRYDLLALILIACGFGSSTGCRPSSRLPVPPPDRRPAFDLLDRPSGELIDETWAAHLIRGAKVGHRQTRVYRVSDSPGGLLQIVTVDHLELRRFGDIAVQELTTASLETDEGDVRRLAYQIENGDTVNRVAGMIDDGELELRRQEATGDEVARYSWPHQQRGIFAVERSLQRHPLQPGERRAIEGFLPLLDRMVRIDLLAADFETIEIEGQERRLLRIEAVDPRSEGWRIPTVYWTDDQGRIQKTQEAFLDRETIVVTQQRALSPNDRVRVDLGVDVGVRVDKPIADPLNVAYAVYRVQVLGLNPQDVFPTGLSQRVLPAEDHVALITVRRVTPQDPAVVDVAVDPPVPEDLAPNALVQSDHPRVKAIADSVAGSVEDPWFAAKLLERHVFGRLDKVDFSQVFGSAAEVAERRRGDCSEHAVLLAAVCRARKIPARVAVGLLYSAQDRSFLYHMWNEVWIRDRWIPLDATLGKGGIGGCHLKLRDSSLARETPYGMVSPVIHLIGRIEIEVQSTQRTMPGP